MSDSIKRNILFGTPGSAKDRNNNVTSGTNSRLTNDNLILSELEAAVQKIGSRKVTIREGGSQSESTMTEVIIAKVFQSAIGGSPMAQRTAISLISKTSEKQAEKNKANADQWVAYKKATKLKLENALKAGEEIPDIFPHPDDVIFDSNNTVKFIGPIDEFEARLLRQQLKTRDLLILQGELDNRCGEVSERDSEHDDVISAHVLAHIVDNSIPPRKQLSEEGFIQEIRHARCHTQRELLSALYKGWRALGLNIKRGTTLPSFELIKPKIELLMECVARVCDGRMNVEDRSEEDVAAEIESVGYELETI